MLLFEFFPAVLAVIVLVVGIVLFAINRRARNDAHDDEAPRTPSQPPVSPDAGTESSGSPRRPSMRA